MTASLHEVARASLPLPIARYEIVRDPSLTRIYDYSAYELWPDIAEKPPHLSDPWRGAEMIEALVWDRVLDEERWGRWRFERLARRFNPGRWDRCTWVPSC